MHLEIKCVLCILQYLVAELMDHVGNVVVRIPKIVNNPCVSYLQLTLTVQTAAWQSSPQSP